MALRRTVPRHRPEQPHRRGDGWRLWRELRNRLGWGIADQALSSVTNFAVVIYVARTLGAAQLGAFSLAYVTYGFMLNAYAALPPIR